MRKVFLILALSAALTSFSAFAKKPRSSMILLIDSTGSMGDAISTSNPDIKIDVAKKAAEEAVIVATQKGLVEIAVLAFQGSCSDPVPDYLDFTTDTQKLVRFIRKLQPDGSTPMAPAVLFANDFMKKRGLDGAKSQLIVLLADGQNDCGDVRKAMAKIQKSGVVFRHETVGFGIEPNSQASEDLQHIATASNGVYHHADNANQLGNVFMEIVDTFTVLDLIGKTGVIGTTTSVTTQSSGQTPPKKTINKGLLKSLKIP